MKELLHGYSAGGFQKELNKLVFQQCGESIAADACVAQLDGRADLVLKVQQEIVGSYGIDSSFDGILQMKFAIRSHVQEGDMEIINLSRKICSKLRLPEPPTEQSVTDLSEFDTPSGNGFFGGQCENPFPKFGSLGYYRLLFPAALSTKASMQRCVVGQIMKDCVVEAKEIRIVDQLVRARLVKPVRGWISLADTSRDLRFAEVVDTIVSKEKLATGKKLAAQLAENNESVIVSKAKLVIDEPIVRVVESVEPEFEPEATPMLIN